MMHKAIIGILGFITGGFFGWMCAAKVIQDKYDALMEEEINSIKKAFHKATDVTKVEEEIKETVDEVKEYEKVLEDTGYTEKAEPVGEKKIFQIKPEQFGDEGFDMISFTYYADKTLTDDADHPMNESDIHDSIGSSDFLKILDEDNDEDALYIRNEIVKADYEIIFDPRTYGEVLRQRPYLNQNL